MKYKHLFAGAALGVLLFPTISLAATPNAQYISLLEQLPAALEQELATLQSNNAAPVVQNTQTNQNTSPVASQAPTAPFEVYQMTWEPGTGFNDIYYAGSEAIEPVSVQIGIANGSGLNFLNGALPTTFTTSFENDSANGCIDYDAGTSANGAELNLAPSEVNTDVKRCGGVVMRLVPSSVPASGTYLVNFTTTDGTTHTDTFIVP